MGGASGNGMSCLRAKKVQINNVVGNASRLHAARRSAEAESPGGLTAGLARLRQARQTVAAAAAATAL